MSATARSFVHPHLVVLLLVNLFCLIAPITKHVMAQAEVIIGNSAQIQRRLELASVPASRPSNSFALMSPHDRRQAIDAYWGPGPSTEVKLQIFDKFWHYVDEKFAAFQGIDVDWAALRDHYRPEVAAGVSRGRFAAIMNQLSLALREGHTSALDLPVNAFTVPEHGVPLFAVGDWTWNQSGACSTAQPDGSALVYSAMPGHPLGLERGDRVLGYDGRPWRELYREVLREEELPLWPLYWGSAPSSFAHTFESSATMNWHLFQTMDIAKSSGEVVHVPTSLMPSAVWYGFCSEQMDIPGVPKPVGTWENDTVSSGVVADTNVGYIYVWAWGPNSEIDFEQALLDLTQIRRVDGLIVDFRFNAGGYLFAPHRGIGVLFPHPTPTTGIDERMNPTEHFKMKSLRSPSLFNMDFEGGTSTRIKVAYDGPIALLVGPGAGSTGDMSSYWMTFHPRVRTFGKSTASSFNLPTQASLGTELNLGDDWFARIAEANVYRVGRPHQYLTHSEFPIDEHVWLRPEDVAAGKDTVVNAAIRWISQQSP